MTTSFILLCDELENVLNETLPKEAMSASHEIVFSQHSNNSQFWYVFCSADTNKTKEREIQICITQLRAEKSAHCRAQSWWRRGETETEWNWATTLLESVSLVWPGNTLGVYFRFFGFFSSRRGILDTKSSDIGIWTWVMKRKTSAPIAKWTLHNWPGSIY